MTPFSLFPFQQFLFCPASHNFTHGLFQHAASCSLHPVSCQSILHSTYKINLLETQFHQISFHFQNHASLSFFLNRTEIAHISPPISCFHHPNVSLLTLMLEDCLMVSIQHFPFQNYLSYSSPSHVFLPHFSLPPFFILLSFLFSKIPSLTTFNNCFEDCPNIDVSQIMTSDLLLIYTKFY